MARTIYIFIWSSFNQECYSLSLMPVNWESITGGEGAFIALALVLARVLHNLMKLVKLKSIAGSNHETIVIKQFHSGVKSQFQISTEET